MEILINNIKDYSKKEQTIVINDRGISLIDGNSCYQKMLCKDIEVINYTISEFSKIMFGWKEEYVGSRMLDGEKYHITVNVNHKKRKYKIQNKFPANWDDFIALKNKIMEGSTND